jgi:Fe2+ or Zn2+ uptake regulation protein
MTTSNLETKLHQKGINPTAMRLLVLEKLSQQKFAISHKDLTALFDRADNTTLFRTLKTFLKHKLIHTIEDGTGLIKHFVKKVVLVALTICTVIFIVPVANKLFALLKL